jgi:hypothetical protein
MLNITVMLIMFGLLQQQHASTGSMKVFVLDSLSNKPITAAVVSISRVGERTGTRYSIEVGKKEVNRQGLAFFDNLSPGKYIVLAMIEKDDVALGRFGKSTTTTIDADSVANVVIQINKASAMSLPSEDWSPNYRMPFMVPDTSMDEPMPRYNPEEWRKMLQDTSKKSDHQRF